MCACRVCGTHRSKAGGVGAPGTGITVICELLLNHLSSLEGSIFNRQMNMGTSYSKSRCEKPPYNTGESHIKSLRLQFVFIEFLLTLNVVLLGHCASQSSALPCGKIYHNSTDLSVL